MLKMIPEKVDVAIHNIVALIYEVNKRENEFFQTASQIRQDIEKSLIKLDKTKIEYLQKSSEIKQKLMDIRQEITMAIDTSNNKEGKDGNSSDNEGPSGQKDKQD